MFLDKLFGKGKESKGFDTLFDDAEEFDKSNIKSTSKKNSFYDDSDSDFLKPKKKGFYGLESSEDSDLGSPIQASKIFHFSWWEYVVILIEFILLIYVILLFAGIFSI
ncbi:MAG: hypothetical protein KAQ83_01130 [Nanoarchaeota archaeon]|nr:hypothetical protein [Nanoarchaeota archaeon]